MPQFSQSEQESCAVWEDGLPHLFEPRNPGVRRSQELTGRVRAKDESVVLVRVNLVGPGQTGSDCRGQVQSKSDLWKLTLTGGNLLRVRHAGRFTGRSQSDVA